MPARRRRRIHQDGPGLAELERLKTLKWEDREIAAALDPRPKTPGAVSQWRRRRRVAGAYPPQLVELVRQAELGRTPGQVLTDPLALTHALFNVRELYRRADGESWRQFELMLDALVRHVRAQG